MGNVEYKLTPTQTLTEKYFDSHTDQLTLNGNVPDSRLRFRLSARMPTSRTRGSSTQPGERVQGLGFLHQYCNSAADNNGLTATEIGMKRVPTRREPSPCS